MKMNTYCKVPHLILLLLAFRYCDCAASLLSPPRSQRRRTFIAASRKERFEHGGGPDAGEDDASNLSARQAGALRELVSSFPHTHGNERDFQNLNQRQADALHHLLHSFRINDDPIETDDGQSTGDHLDAEFSDELSPKQAEALRWIKEGCNVFITGVAGTGKSLLLQRALEYFRGIYRDNSKRYVAVAPTGPTALSLGGQTIHSFAGIGIPKTQDSFSKTRTVKENAKRWKELDSMVVDECSMISGEFFDRLSGEVSKVRKDPRPFGGIQLIVCGDFLQLPPIAPRKTDVREMRAAMGERDQNPDDLFLNRGFCFQSHAWNEANFQVIELDVVFRQKNREYVNILQDIRRGHVTRDALQFLGQCERPLPSNKFGVRPTMLHSRNKDVSRENMLELEKLEGEARVFEAVDRVEPEEGAGPWVRKQLEQNQFFRSCIAEKELQLKIGAQVMLIKSFPRSQLVNGCRGKVVGFTDGEKYPVVQFVNGIKKAIQPQTFESRLVGLGTCVRTAVPLKLAWAITTHKAQGLTLDYVIADVGGVFGEAQTYVALSRATDQKGLELRNFSKKKVRANPTALAFYSDPGGTFPTWDGNATQKNAKKKTPDHAPVERHTVGNNQASETNGFDRCTVRELKVMLSALGLPTSGRKAELTERIRSSLPHKMDHQ
jgi:ATP-dependent DNA helicase PIF1